MTSKDKKDNRVPAWCIHKTKKRRNVTSGYQPEKPESKLSNPPKRR